MLKLKKFSDDFRVVKMSCDDDYTCRMTIDKDGKLVKMEVKKFKTPDEQFHEVDHEMLGKVVDMDNLKDVVEEAEFNKIVKDIVLQEDDHELGDIIEVNGMKGYIIGFDEDHKPNKFLSVDNLKGVNWFDAMEWDKKLKNGWHVPSKSEFESISDRIVKLQKLIGLKILGYWLWSSSEYSAGGAWGLNAGLGDVFTSDKSSSGISIRARAYLSLG